ncbi:MAG: hypothetical protein JWN63_2560 [Candidatus Acidoferrum typicum]|nr:hypothetical protein [Candidatus Acidoferrum typicum]
MSIIAIRFGNVNSTLGQLTGEVTKKTKKPGSIGNN